MTVKLHVGYIGVTREGQRVEIFKTDNNPPHPFKATNGEWYAENGCFDLDNETPSDIIGPWVEPVKSPIETVTHNKLVEGLYGGGVSRIVKTICIAFLFLWLVAQFSDVDRDDSDGTRDRSGFEILTDCRTKLQYLSTRRGGLTPRLDVEGRHIAGACE